MELNLQYFTGHGVTVYSDSGFSAAAASPYSSVDKDTEVTLSYTLNTGKELDEIEVVSGGPITISSAGKFSMPDNDVVLSFKSKANNTYMVLENVCVGINGAMTELKRNVTLKTSANGQICGVETDGSPVSVSADIIASLVKDGIIVKM